MEEQQRLHRLEEERLEREKREGRERERMEELFQGLVLGRGGLQLGWWAAAWRLGQPWASPTPDTQYWRATDQKLLEGRGH